MKKCYIAFLCIAYLSTPIKGAARRYQLSPPQVGQLQQDFYRFGIPGSPAFNEGKARTILSQLDDAGFTKIADQLRAKQLAALQKTPAPAAPVSASVDLEALENEVHQLRTLNRDLHQQLDLERHQADLKLQALQQEYDVLRQELTKQGFAAPDVKAHFEKEIAHIIELQKADLLKIKAQVQDLEKRNTELTRQLAQQGEQGKAIAALHQKLQDAHVAINEATGKNVMLLQEIEKLKNQQTSMEERIKTYEDELAQAKSQQNRSAQQAQEVIKQIKLENEQTQQSFEAILRNEQDQRSVLEKQLSEIRKDCEHIIAQKNVIIDGTEKKLQILNKRLEEAQDQIQEAESSIQRNTETMQRRYDQKEHEFEQAKQAIAQRSKEYEEQKNQLQKQIEILNETLQKKDTLIETLQDKIAIYEQPSGPSSFVGGV